MKFLTIGSLKDVFYTLPPAEQQKLAKALIDFMKQRKKAEVLEMYSMAGWNRFMIIAEHKSAESLLEAIMANPMGAFYDFETYPIAEVTDEMLKAYLKAAEKPSPRVRK